MVMRKKKASLERIFDRRKKEPKQLVSGKIQTLLVFLFSRNCKNVWLELIFYKFLLTVKFPGRAEILFIF